MQREMRSASSRVCVALLIVVALAALSARFALIDDSLPYCRHGDESTWADRALTILQTGDLNPHRFTKPGAHVYFMTAGFALGFVRAAANLEVDSLPKIGREVCTTYPVPEVAKVAKQLYALVSVLAMVVAGFLARRLIGADVALVLAPLFVAVSGSYLYYSWFYMNTNVLGAFTILSVVAYPFLRRDGVSSQREAVLLGILCGLTLATKYNLFLIFLPAFTYFVLYHSDRWLSHCLVAVGAGLLTFFVVTPYALLDVPQFLGDVGREAYHYAYGHFDGSKHTFEPGWPMFEQYYGVLHESFGGFVLLLSVLGLGRLLFVDWRAAAVVFQFPLLFLYYMSQQKVFFERNLMSVQLFVGIASTAGFLFLVGLLRDRLTSLAWFESRGTTATTATASAIAVGALTLALLPWANMDEAYEPHQEPRNQAVAWVLEHAEPGRKVLVDFRIGLSTDLLIEEGFEVVQFRSKPGSNVIDRLRNRHGAALILIPEFRQDEYNELYESVEPLTEFGKIRVDGTSSKSCGRFPPKVIIGSL